jgi:hypothetical protein
MEINIPAFNMVINGFTYGSKIGDVFVFDVYEEIILTSQNIVVDVFLGNGFFKIIQITDALITLQTCDLDKHLGEMPSVFFITLMDFMKLFSLQTFKFDNEHSRNENRTDYENSLIEQSNSLVEQSNSLIEQSSSVHFHSSGISIDISSKQCPICLKGFNEELNDDMDPLLKIFFPCNSKNLSGHTMHKQCVLECIRRNSEPFPAYRRKIYLGNFNHKHVVTEYNIPAIVTLFQCPYCKTCTYCMRPDVANVDRYQEQIPFIKGYIDNIETFKFYPGLLYDTI